MTIVDTREQQTLEPVLDQHLRHHLETIEALRDRLPDITRWGERLADRLLHGQRLLAAGNGGSAAEAQHLTAELVGRFDGERRPFSALSLHAESSSLTAIGNDYGYDQVFARQVLAHARAGDILMLFSTSGKSPNLLAAAEAARRVGATTWALTGAGPNALCLECDEHIALPGTGAAVQEAQLVMLHLLCRVFDARVHSHDAAAHAPSSAGRRGSTSEGGRS
ncbi:SIS domain-containing protein [Cnuibacter sp. UC19_7]|uniref:D-sedoheptulose-7-phosphate isomerase n=1 Tax=Cnuibacter sp. UC19_7 TaxID=3350166 RepID=UPI003670E7E5